MDTLQHSGAQPKWQAARVTQGANLSAVFEDLRGVQVWVEARPPQPVAAWCANGAIDDAPSYPTHVSAEPYYLGSLRIDAVDLELLPQFADHVEPIALDDWLAAIRAERAGAQ